MFAQLVRLWTGQARGRSTRTSRTCRSGSIARGPERLEERLALSATMPGAMAPSGCTCPCCSGAFAPAGGTAYNARTHWEQPGGTGSLVTITYSYNNLLDGRLGGGLSSSTIRRAVEEALQRWAAVAPLRFVEVADSGPATPDTAYDPTGKPMLRFAHRGLDGPSNVLAHAYYPGNAGLAGDVVFDSSENWKVDPSSGIDLIEVATHELGHALGLGHETNTQAIMNPYYGRHFRGPGTSFLFQDDVSGIRALYGSGVGSVTPLSPGEQPPPPSGPFRIVGNVLFVDGTSGDDTFVFDGVERRVALNDDVFSGDLSGIASIVFDGKGGHDRAQLAGTAAAERFELRPGLGSVTGGTWNVRVSNAEEIRAVSGAGDRLALFDSRGNDYLTLTPTASVLYGGGCLLIGEGFRDVVATASTGHDRAWLIDSPENDTYWATPRQAQMSGPGFVNTASNFDRVTAYANQGQDRATLFGSAGTDIFSAAPLTGHVTNLAGTFFLAAEGFDQINGDGYLGVDYAALFDSEGDDLLVAGKASTSLSGNGYRLLASNFEQILAFAEAGGNDQAAVYDSTGNDHFVGNAGTGSMTYAGVGVQFTGFRSATLYGLAGGRNTRSLRSPSFSIAWVGSWI